MRPWAIVPAYNEQDRIARTIKALQGHVTDHVLVVDDGSSDETADEAARCGAEVIRLPENRGKGRAVTVGIGRVLEDEEAAYIVLADADLGACAGNLSKLVEAVQHGGTDLAIAAFRSPGGFGLARRMASAGILWLTGYKATSPLSGQRALSRTAAEQLFPYTPGWGLEVGMTVRALWNGLHITEIPLPLTHRATKRDLAGFWHRGRQCAAVASTLWRLAYARQGRPDGAGQ